MLRKFTTLILMISMLLMGACMQKAPEVPKEGDVVTWMHNSSLIIKTKLGQRREHIVDSKMDPLIYEPEYERFIGQFPIDYVPERFPKFTEAERVAFEAEDAKKLHALKSMHPIEFSLMLNEVKGKATDDSPIGPGGIDDPNQVKVLILGRRVGVQANTQEAFELNLSLKDDGSSTETLDVSSKETKVGLDCYLINNGKGWKRCFGHSTNPSISGFEFAISPDSNVKILARSIESIYGGIEVQWFTDQKNIYRAREIDAAIWRLLEAWNVAPNKIN